MVNLFCQTFSKTVPSHQKNCFTEEARAGAVFRGAGALANPTYIAGLKKGQHCGKLASVLVLVKVLGVPPPQYGAFLPFLRVLLS